MSESATIAVTDASFEADVLNSETPVVVDFWAEWCAPCRAIAPTLEEIATEMKGQVTIAKLDIDHNPEKAMEYGVRGIPTLLMFKDGEVVATKVGAADKTNLSGWIASSISTSNG